MNMGFFLTGSKPEFPLGSSDRAAGGSIYHRWARKTSGNLDGFVKSFSRPFMAKYPKGTMFRCQFLLFRQPDASVNEAVRTLVP
jgi:hypothetical protein